MDNGTNRISGFSYDAAGNLLNDGMHSYTYDPEGNVVSVDGGTTAQYTYDALNHRVKEVVGGVTERISFDLNGRRSNSWHDGSTGMDSAQYYAGGTPVAFWTAIDGHIHFQHQDWLGTERARSGFTSVTDVRFASQAFGEGLSSSGPYNADWDPYHFAGQDHDTESDTEHATFRQYQPVQGRWMSPDPYDGSYDLSDPQSFNRYSYVSNNPLALTDPDGMVMLAGSGGGGGAGDIVAGILQALFEGIADAFSGLFGPSFQGSITPRPAVRTFTNMGNSERMGGNGEYTLVANYGGYRDVSSSSFSFNSVDLLDVGAPNDPVCSIQVKCRGIEYKHLGMLGAQHCDAQAADPSGITHSLSGGLDGDPMNSTLNAWDTPNPTIPFTGMRVYTNPNSCKLATCLINSTDRYHNSAGRPHYNGVSGPNSNTWLKTTFSGCGANIPINTLGGIW